VSYTPLFPSRWLFWRHSKTVVYETPLQHVGRNREGQEVSFIGVGSGRVRHGGRGLPVGMPQEQDATPIGDKGLSIRTANYTAMSRRHIPSEKRTEMLRLRKEGLTIKEIAAKVGFSTGTVQSSTRELSRPYFQIPERTANRIRQLRLEGVKLWAIANQLHVGYTSVRKILKSTPAINMDYDSYLVCKFCNASLQVDTSKPFSRCTCHKCNTSFTVFELLPSRRTQTKVTKKVNHTAMRDDYFHSYYQKKNDR
jgi:transposase-like protein